MRICALATAIALLASVCMTAGAEPARTGAAVGETAIAESTIVDFDATPILEAEPAALSMVRSPRISAPSIVEKSQPTTSHYAVVDKAIQERVARRLGPIATQLSQLSQLDLTNDVEWTTEGAARYLSDAELTHPENLLYDGQLSGQGLFLNPGEPFTVKLTFAAYQRIQSVQVLYAGEWDAAGIPEARVIGVLSGGKSQEIGSLAPITNAPQRQPVVQQLNFDATPAGKDNDWRRIYLEFRDVPAKMGLVEVRVVGFDRDVKNIARAIHSLSQTPDEITSGNISSLAAMTRARRLPGEKSAAKDTVVAELSAMVTELSGLRIEIEMGEVDTSGAAPALPAKIIVHNASDIELEWSMVKLQLPAGWRAAPSRFTVEELDPHETIYLPLTFWPGDNATLYPSAYLYGAYDGQPIFVMTSSPFHNNPDK